MIQNGLKVKWCNGIKASESTLREKLEIDKTKMESEEQKAIFRMLCKIKQDNIKRGGGSTTKQLSFHKSVTVD